MGGDDLAFEKSEVTDAVVQKLTVNVTDRVTERVRQPALTTAVREGSGDPENTTMCRYSQEIESLRLHDHNTTTHIWR